MQTSSNDIKRWMPLCRGGSALAAALMVAPALWQVVVEVGAAAGAGVPVRADEALTAMVAAGALVTIGWFALGILLGLAALVPGAVGRRAERLAEVATPALVRRLVGGLLGVGLAAGLSPGAAVAAPPRALVTAPAPLPDPGFEPLPDPAWGAPTADIATTAAATAPTTRASTGSPTARPPASAPPATTPWVAPPPLVRVQPDVRVLSPSPRPGVDEGGEQVVVHRGDSLWSIAARHLGRQACDAEIARSWPAWFAANREVIGDDPDLLRPGQLLRPPDGVGS